MKLNLMYSKTMSYKNVFHKIYHAKKLVTRDGLEPSTPSLKVKCSTN